MGTSTEERDATIGELLRGKLAGFLAERASSESTAVADSLEQDRPAAVRSPAWPVVLLALVVLVAALAALAATTGKR
jgi:hypothetical protein